MAAGTYVLNRPTYQAAMNTNYSNSYFVGEVGTFDREVILKSALVRFYSTGTFNGRVVVWKQPTGGGTQVMVYASAPFNQAIANTTAEVELVLPDPPTLPTLPVGDSYDFGLWSGTGAQPGYVSGSSVGGVALVGNYPTTPSGIIYTRTSAFAYAQSGYNNPPNSGSNNYTVAGGWSFDIPLPPSAPTVSSNTPVNLGNPLTVSWTHNDANGDQAAKHQIRYRKKDV